MGASKLTIEDSLLFQELRERVKNSDTSGCSFGKVNREKIEQLEHRTSNIIDIIEKITLRMNVTDVLLIIVAMLTGSDLVMRMFSFFGIIK